MWCVCVCVVCVSHPLSPPPPTTTTGLCFFNGWYVRVTDHERQLAFALIVGSFKHPGANTYTEHYVALVYADRQGNLLTAHAFPDPDSVTIDMDRCVVGIHPGCAAVDPWTGRRSAPLNP
jgi:hypothetical protein